MVPENTRFMGSSISINTIVIAFLFLSIILSSKFKINKIDKKIISILLFFILYCFVTLFFAKTGNLAAQLGKLLEFIITQCLPAVAAVLIIRKRNQIAIFNKAFTLATIVTCIYGIFTYVIKKNLYVEALTGKVLEASAWKGYATFATFTSTTTFGYFLALAIPYMIFFTL